MIDKDFVIKQLEWCLDTDDTELSLKILIKFLEDLPTQPVNTTHPIVYREYPNYMKNGEITSSATELKNTLAGEPRLHKPFATYQD